MSSRRLDSSYEVFGDMTRRTSISYAKLNQVSAVKAVPHFSTPPTIQTRLPGVEPTPYFNYMKISAFYDIRISQVEDLGEMAFKEANLMLEGRIRSICISTFHREVIE